MDEETVRLIAKLEIEIAQLQARIAVLTEIALAAEGVAKTHRSAQSIAFRRLRNALERWNER